MFLFLILIYKIILCSDEKYLHFSRDNLNVTGMNALGLRALAAVNGKVCRLRALIQLRFGRTAGLSGQPDYQDSRIIGTAGLLGRPDYRDGRIIGTAGLSGHGTCHLHLVTDI
jgi:hypothetical protein